MKTIISLLIFTCIMQQAKAQIQWQHCYGGTYADECNAIRQTFDSGYILAGGAGSNNDDVSGNHGRGDFWVVKIAASGSIEWQKCYGGDSTDVAYDIRQTTDSGYVVVGNTYSSNGDVSGNHGGRDIWVIKISSTGALQWQKCLGGSGDDIVGSVGQTNDGGYIIAGSTNSYNGDVSGNHGYYDAWVVKLANTGNIIWTRCYGGSSSDGATTVQQTFDGGYIVGANSSSADGDVTGHHGDTLHSDFWLVKLAANDSLEWERSLGGTDDDGEHATIQTRDSGYIMAGYTLSTNGDVTGHIGSGPAGQDGWVVKLSRSGIIQWDKCIYVCGDEMLNALAQASDAGYIICGYTCANIVGHGTALYGKLSDTGGVDWINSYGGTLGDFFNSVTPTNDGSGIAAGYAESNDEDVSGNHGIENYWVVKFGMPTSVPNIEKTNTFTMVPNPVSQYLNVTASCNIASITISNTLGQQVFSGKYDTEKATIDVSALPHGVYFVKINGNETGRFVKK